jgi:hypothetical protein
MHTRYYPAFAHSINACMAPMVQAVGAPLQAEGICGAWSKISVPL